MVETCYWPSYRDVTIRTGNREWREVERFWASAGTWHGRPIQVEHDGCKNIGPYAEFPICDEHDLFADTIWGTISGFVTCRCCSGFGWGPDTGEDWADGELRPDPDLIGSTILQGSWNTAGPTIKHPSTSALSRRDTPGDSDEPDQPIRP